MKSFILSVALCVSAAAAPAPVPLGFTDIFLPQGGNATGWHPDNTMPKIFSPASGTWNGFAEKNAQASQNGYFFYNNDGSQTAFYPVPFTNRDDFNILSLHNFETVVINETNLIAVGLSISGDKINVFEFTTVGSPIPTSLNLVTNFTIISNTNGAYQGGNQFHVRALADNSVACFPARTTFPFVYNPLYRSSSGVWTNMGEVNLGGGAGIPTTLVGLAEMLADGSVWTFGTKDAWGSILATRWVTSSGGKPGLYMTTNIAPVNVQTTGPNIGAPPANYVWGYLAPYGEICDIDSPMSDAVSNRIIIPYNDAVYTGGVGNRTLYIANAGLAIGTTNFYLFGVSSNQILRFASGFTISQIGTNFYQAYVQWTTNGGGPPFKFFFQGYNDSSVSSTPYQLPYLGGYGPIAHHERRLDFIVQELDTSWHLWLMNNNPSTYYVWPEQGDDTLDGRTFSTAWKHIPGTIGVTTGTGWAVLTNGCKLYVHGGSTIYNRVELNPTWFQGSAAFDSIQILNGNYSNPFFGLGKPIVDGGTTNTAGFAITGSLAAGPLNGITIDGFEVRNIAAGAAGPGYDNSTGSSCILAGSSVYPANWLTIKRCYLHDAARIIDNEGHGIEFAGFATNFIVTQNTIGPAIGTKGVEPYRASFGVVSNNYFAGTGDHSVSLNASTNVDVANNTINMVPPQVHEPTYAISVAGSTNCDIWNNVIYRVAPFANSAGQDYSMGIGCYAGGQSNRIVNNTVSFFGDYVNGNGSTAIRVLDTTGIDRGLIFQNNLMYGNWNADGSSYCVWTNYVSTENVRFNDIFNSSNTTVMCYQGGSGGPSFCATVAGSGLNSSVTRTYASNQQLDPVILGGAVPDGVDVFFRPNKPCFSLSSLTPQVLRNTANVVLGDFHGFDHSAGKFSLDIGGVTRSGWSMGAYEVIGGPPGVSRTIVLNGNSKVINNVKIQ